MSRLRLTMLLTVAAAIAMLVVGIASAPGGRGGSRVIEVRPGGLQGAIERANSGDTLRIHAGHYRGAIAIEKPLRLIGVKGERRPLIDGRCEARVTIAVRAPGVVLRRLHVVGADEAFGPVPSEVDFSNVARGRATDLLLRDTCDAEYGINVFASAEVDVIGNRGYGFSDAAFYVGSIDGTGDGVLRVSRNLGSGNNRGVIVEDIFAGRIRVVGNRLINNRAAGLGQPTGIFLHRADGVLIRDNVVRDNGRFGIHLDPNSDDNRLFGNVVRRNPGGNFRDEGTGNCGARNKPNPFPPC